MACNVTLLDASSELAMPGARSSNAINNSQRTPFFQELLKTVGTTDYTRLPIGTKLEKGEIQICSYCGRPGYAQTIDGKKHYTHSEIISRTVDADKSWKIDFKWDSCPTR
jgi:hypothetical protein